VFAKNQELKSLENAFGPLAAIISSYLLWRATKGFADLDLGTLSHSSWQIPSSFVRLNGEGWCAAALRSPHRFHIEFKSKLGQTL